ncbi:LacI family DNA-binding transcriptional regulator [Deinococcus sp.]|uniref:LacI family DNA-binding transcriptional regulator n=1 Tax=Deinococcus sp. TaxID=47478 RepID=UPI003B5C0A08
MTPTRSKILAAAPRRARQRQGVTISDVASAAGVAVMTASRALNKPEMVSELLRRRVQDAVEQLGYIPDQVAGNLASGSSRVIPIVIPTLSHPVYLPTLNALQDTLAAEYQILLATSEYSPEHEEKLIQVLLGWRPSGLVLSGIDHTERATRMLRGAGLPIVELMDFSPTPLDLNVGFDHAAVGRAVAEMFLTRGRVRPVYAGSVLPGDSRSTRRRQAFEAVLSAASLPAGRVTALSEPSSIPAGGRLLEAVLSQYPDTDAVFVTNDDLAVGAVAAALRRGLRVPQDIAILGFNDQEIAAHVTPPVSSVRTPRFEIGQIAARMLLSRLAGEPQQQAVDVGFEIIHRATT